MAQTNAGTACFPDHKCPQWLLVGIASFWINFWTFASWLQNSCWSSVHQICIWGSKKQVSIGLTELCQSLHPEERKFSQKPSIGLVRTSHGWNSVRGWWVPQSVRVAGQEEVPDLDPRVTQETASDAGEAAWLRYRGCAQGCYPAHPIPMPRQ